MSDTWVLVGIIIVAPLCITVVLNRVHARRATPLAFHCRRCGHEFRRPPHEPYPRACPRCSSTAWSSP